MSIHICYNSISKNTTVILDNVCVKILRRQRAGWVKPGLDAQFKNFIKIFINFVKTLSSKTNYLLFYAHVSELKSARCLQLDTPYMATKRSFRLLHHAPLAIIKIPQHSTIN